MAIGDKVSRPGHVQYGDLLFGPGTPYRWQEITGWEELPALDSGTVPRAGAHGAFPGRLLAQSRTIGLDGLMVRAPRDRIGAVVGALSAGTVPVVDERPFVAWLDERGPLLAYARATKRAVPAGRGYRLGVITGGALEFEAADPRRYALLERSSTAALPMDEPGLAWPLEWPLSFGAVGSTGGLAASNSGDADTHPVVTFRGPLVRPSLTNVATGDVLEYDLPLSGTDRLVIDTCAGTVTLNGTASRIYTATSRSVPEQTYVLPPGTSDFLFRAAPGPVDPAASVTLRWRSAFW